MLSQSSKEKAKLVRNKNRKEKKNFEYTFLLEIHADETF